MNTGTCYATVLQIAASGNATSVNLALLVKDEIPGHALPHPVESGER